MINEQAVEQRARQIAALIGIGIEAARYEARIELGYVGAQALRAQAAQREAEQQPRDALAGYEARDHLATVAIEAPRNPQRVAYVAQERARIEARQQAISEQIAALRREWQELENGKPS